MPPPSLDLPIIIHNSIGRGESCWGLASVYTKHTTIFLFVYKLWYCRRCFPAHQQRCRDDLTFLSVSLFCSLIKCWISKYGEKLPLRSSLPLDWVLVELLPFPVITNRIITVTLMQPLSPLSISSLPSWRHWSFLLCWASKPMSWMKNVWLSKYRVIWVGNSSTYSYHFWRQLYSDLQFQ